MSEVPVRSGEGVAVPAQEWIYYLLKVTCCAFAPFWDQWQKNGSIREENESKHLLAVRGDFCECGATWRWRLAQIKPGLTCSGCSLVTLCVPQSPYSPYGLHTTPFGSAVLEPLLQAQLWIPNSPHHLPLYISLFFGLHGHKGIFSPKLLNSKRELEEKEIQGAPSQQHLQSEGKKQLNWG